MSRKPIDQQQPSECRQAIWDEIRSQRGAFTIKNIDVKLDPNSIRDYLKGLCKAGHLEKIDVPFPTPVRLQHYRLVNDTGIEAPRVRKNGTLVTQGQGRRQMWDTMRILKEFSAVDLAFNASTDEHQVAVTEAQHYCAALVKAGYLVGVSGQRYRLIPSMWTGPQPPQIQRTKQVYDPNQRKVVWARIEGGAE